MTPEQEKLYYEALLELADRYEAMIVDEDAEEDNDDILEFIDLFYEKALQRYPLLKLNRWLGYIQGVLIEREFTTVEEERNFTRPLFRPIDFEG
jgi:hypothetical protein